jgi:hypothetical protein
MQTLTIKCKNDTISEHIYSLLSHLPKNEVVISKSAVESELEKHKKLIQHSFDDLKSGNVTKTGKIVRL